MPRPKLTTTHLATACIATHAYVVIARHQALPLAPLLVALALALGLTLAYALADVISLRPALALTAISLAAILAIPRAAPAAGPPLDTPLTLSGIVLEVEPSSHHQARILLAEPEADTFALDRPIRVTFDWIDPLPTPGSAIRFDARLGRPRAPFNPTTIPRDEPPLYATALTIPTAADRTASWSTAVALDLRRQLTFDSASATALYRALILGDRSELDPETRYAYQDTGTAHLLAISGMNLALVGVGLFRLLLFLLVRGGHVPGLRRLGLARLVQGHRPRVIAAALALAVTVAYTELIAPSDATDRALAALAITFGGILLYRGTSAARVLTLCFLGAAVVAPDTLLHAGFQLSFAATASLVVVAPHVTRLRAWLTARIRQRLARWLALAIASLVIADLACFLATAPLTVAWFGQLPLSSLWVNLVAIPFMTIVVYPAGVIWLLLASAIPPLGAALAAPLAALGDAFNDFIRVSGEVSGTASTGSWPLVLGMLASVGLLALMTLRRRPLRLGAAGLVLAAALALAARAPAAGLSLTAVDVGHGDALALRLPDGTRVLVDTGGRASHDPTAPDPNRPFAERVLVPALRALDFTPIDLLVLTHSDMDHVGAAAALSERIPIRHLFLGPCVRSAAVRALAERLAARGTIVHGVARSPPFDFGGATFEILAPSPAVEGPRGCSVHDNDASLVMRVSYAGRHVLLTGDIEARTEAELVALYGSDLAADVLKVPHHGSRTSSTDAFLDAVHPRIALVSGADRKRPPPHPAVLARYAARGIDTYLTGTRGATTAHVAPDGGLSVEALRPLTPP